VRAERLAFLASACPPAALIGTRCSDSARLEDGEPNDPAGIRDGGPANWTVGETFSTGRGHQWRILAIDAAIDDELVDQGINAVFTVEQI
jgi:hypothetical protein